MSASLPGGRFVKAFDIIPRATGDPHDESSTMVLPTWSTLYPIRGVDARSARPDTRRMLACVRSATVLGVEADDVFVEVDVAPGLPSFTKDGTIPRR